MQVGDKVKILGRNPKSHGVMIGNSRMSLDEIGWDRRMDQFVGDVRTITEVCSLTDYFSLEGATHSEGRCSFLFAPEWLEAV